MGVAVAVGVGVGMGVGVGVDAGMYSPALARAFMLMSNPPARSTIPLGSSVAVCEARAVKDVGNSPAVSERKGCVVEKQAEPKQFASPRRVSPVANCPFGSFTTP
jgi:hypothetical protein